MLIKKTLATYLRQHGSTALLASVELDELEDDRTEEKQPLQDDNPIIIDLDQELSDDAKQRLRQSLGNFQSAIAETILVNAVRKYLIANPPDKDTDGTNTRRISIQEIERSLKLDVLNLEKMEALKAVDQGASSEAPPGEDYKQSEDTHSGPSISTSSTSPGVVIFSEPAHDGGDDIDDCKTPASCLSPRLENGASPREVLIEVGTDIVEIYDETTNNTVARFSTTKEWHEIKELGKLRKFYDYTICKLSLRKLNNLGLMPFGTFILTLLSFILGKDANKGLKLGMQAIGATSTTFNSVFGYFRFLYAKYVSRDSNKPLRETMTINLGVGVIQFVKGFIIFFPQSTLTAGLFAIESGFCIWDIVRMYATHWKPLADKSLSCCEKVTQTVKHGLNKFFTTLGITTAIPSLLMEEGAPAKAPVGLFATASVGIGLALSLWRACFGKKREKTA